MWQFRDSPKVAVIAAGLAAACGDVPTEARAPEPGAAPDAEVQPAYSTEQFGNVLAGLEDASQRVVAGITHEATASAVQAAMAALSEELVSNNPIRIRRAIDSALEIVDRLSASAGALEHAAELESVKLVLTNAALLLPVQFSQ